MHHAFVAGGATTAWGCTKPVALLVRPDPMYILYPKSPPPHDHVGVAVDRMGRRFRPRLVQRMEQSNACGGETLRLIGEASPMV